MTRILLVSFLCLLLVSLTGCEVLGNLIGNAIAYGMEDK